MKIAGRKNAGAWYRANKFIKSLGIAEREQLRDLIVASDYIEPAFNNMGSLAAELGTSAAVETVGEWADVMVEQGIPLQIWMGKLSFTTYSKVTVDGEERYVANYQSEFHYFARDLRKIVTRAMFGFREINDISNADPTQYGNPGKLPNIDPET